VAATNMSQIRSALRAYAWQGADPAAVLRQLDRLVEAFGMAQLVTVFYGVLSAPLPDGSRHLSYANAGHLAPLIQLPGGEVRSLTGGRSILIGASSDHPRVSAREIVPAGSTLLLFTDGLVEVPGGSLDESVQRLAATAASHDPRRSAEELCERVIRAMPNENSFDDVAILAVKLTATGTPGGADPGRRAPEPVAAPDGGAPTDLPAPRAPG
jgi:serine phosphatase RsbU (regulator of sigma subunit)